MKILNLFFTISLIFLSCNVTKKNKSGANTFVSKKISGNETDSLYTYRIIDIEQFSSIRVAWAQRQNKIYRTIISSDSLDCVQKIESGRSYRLKLISYFDRIMGPDIKMSKVRISAVKFREGTVPIIRTDSIVSDLFVIEKCNSQ